MATITNRTGKASSISGGMAIAAFLSMITTLILSAVIAKLLDVERITWEQAGYWIMGLLYIASFIGGKSASAAIKRQKVLICIMSGVLYWGLMLCITALFFGAKFTAVWETAGMIAAGCGTAALLPEAHKKKHEKRIGKSYR